MKLRPSRHPAAILTIRIHFSKFGKFNKFDNNRQI